MNCAPLTYSCGNQSRNRSWDSCFRAGRAKSVGVVRLTIVFKDEWEDTDFLEGFAEKSVAADVKDSDTKAIELKLIQLKNTATARE